MPPGRAAWSRHQHLEGEVSVPVREPVLAGLQFFVTCLQDIWDVCLPGDLLLQIRV